jgi:hypothetical protein
MSRDPDDAPQKIETVGLSDFVFNLRECWIRARSVSASWFDERSWFGELAWRILRKATNQVIRRLPQTDISRRVIHLSASDFPSSSVPLLSFLVPIHSYPSLISVFLSLSFPSSRIFLSYPRSRIGKEREGKLF